MLLTVDPLAAAQLSPAGRATLAAVPAAAVVTVVGPPHSATGDAVAAVLAETHPDHQVYLVAPDGARWTVSDVDTDIVARTRYAPDVHQHVVVTDAHRATGTVHDRLLKVLEESAPGTTVWLTHPVTDTLPDALRGRSATTVHPDPATLPEMADTLAATIDELSPVDAETVLRLADGNLALAAAAARFELHAPLRTYAAPRHTDTPTVAAAALAVAVAHLAVAHHHKTKRAPVAPVAKKGTAATVDLTRLTPAAKATVRRLVDAVLRRWERDIVTDLAVADTAHGRRLCTQLEQLRQVRDAGVFSTPVPTLLAAAFVAANS